MASVKLRYVYRDKDRQGRERWLLRMPGHKAITLKGAHGSPEFMATYNAAITGIGQAPKIGTGTVKHGTVAASARMYFASARFAALADATKRAYRKQIEPLVTQHGSKHVSALEPKHVRALLEQRSAGSAPIFLSVLRVLMDISVEQGWRKDDPCSGVKRPKQKKSDGWHCWSEAEIAQYEGKHPIGTQARLALALALYTGQRASDLVRMGPQHLCTVIVEGKRPAIRVKQQKTGRTVTMPLAAPLREAIEATPSDGLVYLVTASGRPYTRGAFLSRQVRQWAREAGLSNVPLHGLRKAAARRLAEAGCSSFEVASITGHASLREVERYTRSAAQERLAEQAITKTENYTRAYQPYTQEKKA